MSRGLCIAIHDVAPATWSECETLLQMLERIGPLPVTLLVVPDYHHRGRADRAPSFVRAVNTHVVAGAEVALHGYFHLDEAGPPRDPVAWVRRQVLTDREGEFAALTADEAASRIERGRAQLEACGWNVSGFVPPAWLAGKGALEAIRYSGLSYTSSYTHLTRLTDGARIGAPCLTASVRTAWRRLGSRLWLNTVAMAVAGAPLVRIALHPSDARFPRMTAQWVTLIERLRDGRTVLTKRQAVEQYRCAT